MSKIIENLADIGLSFWRNLKHVFVSIARLLLDTIFRLVNLILPLTTLAYMFKQRAPGLWRALMKVGFIKRMVSRNVFRKFGSAAPARPHAFSLAADYTTWESLTDRAYTGRHLPPISLEQSANLPPQEKIIDLFMRQPDASGRPQQIDCIRSTFMFAAFAQWFTDSFLRTDHAFDFDDCGNVKRDSAGAPLRLPGREKRNTSTHEIDLCQIYGLNARQTDILRLKSETDRGCLKFQSGDDGEYPPFLLSAKPANGQTPLAVKPEFKDLHPDERILRSIFLRADHNDRGYETIFAAGLEHSNATIGNALLNTIFLREHNRVARLIAAANPSWDDERVFQTTRNVMIVLLLKIVISDYIRDISPLNLPLEFQPGFAEAQGWFRTNRISIEFNLLYRWHGLVPNEFSFMPSPADPNAFRHNNNWLLQNGVAKAVSVFSREKAGRIGIGNTVPYLRGVKADTVTLMRAARLAPYNAYRKRFGLSPAKTFDDVTKDKAHAARLSALYDGDIGRLEWYVGMTSEDHGPDMIMGELLMCMVAHDAFTQALTNPLLSIEAFREETFSPAGWAVINETSTLSHIIDRITGGGSVFCAFSHAPA